MFSSALGLLLHKIIHASFTTPSHSLTFSLAALTHGPGLSWPQHPPGSRSWSLCPPWPGPSAPPASPRRWERRWWGGAAGWTLGSHCWRSHQRWLQHVTVKCIFCIYYYSISSISISIQCIMTTTVSCPNMSSAINRNHSHKTLCLQTLPGVGVVVIQRCPLAYPRILSRSSCLVPGGEPGAAVPCPSINNINNAACAPPHWVPQSHSGVKVQLGASFSSLQMMSSQHCISGDTAVGEIIDTAGAQTMSLPLLQSRDKMTTLQDWITDHQCCRHRLHATWHCSRGQVDTIHHWWPRKQIMVRWGSPVISSGEGWCQISMNNIKILEVCFWSVTFFITDSIVQK